MLDSMVQNLMFLSAPGGRPCRMVGQVAGRSLAETGRDGQSSAEPGSEAEAGIQPDQRRPEPGPAS